MKNFCHLIALLGLSVLLFRCEEPVELDLDIPESKLVLVSNFFPNENVEVRISSSQSILTSNKFPSVNNATVKILEGNEEQEQLIFRPGNADTMPYYVTEHFQPQVGVDYTIVASAPGFDVVTAISAIPAPVPITFFEQRSIFSEEKDDGTTEYDVGVGINYDDPEQIDTYYHLRLMQEIEICREIPGSTLRNCGGPGYSYWILVQFPEDGPFAWEAVASGYGGGILLKDKPLPGILPLEVKTKVNSGGERLGRISAQLRVVSPEYYDFNSSLSRQLSNNNNPFVEPVPIENNVDNGLGVFAGYNYAQDTLTLSF